MNTTRIPDLLADVPLPDTDAHIGIYIHIPFCQKHCPYCDFAVVTGMLHTADTYVDALCAEIRHGAAHHAPNPPVTTIFLGGGTPSLLRARQIGRILDTVREVFDVLPNAEITLEANPGPLRLHHLAGFRAAGITRISLGMQTFNAGGLASLGRLHTPQDGYDAIAAARAAGFDNLSLDLIFGWEGQTIADWQADLEAATALGMDHLSVYSLTVEEGTPLSRAVASGATVLPDDDTGADLFLLANEQLTAAGFVHYEVSNYAQPGHRSRHNCLYWQNGDYLGFGVGAHSHRHDRRWWNVRDYHAYLQRIAAGGAEEDGENLPPATAMGETMMVGLRLLEGVSEAAFRQRHGVALAEAYGGILAEYIARGWVSHSGGRVALTATGRLLADGIAGRFLEG